MRRWLAEKGFKGEGPVPKVDTAIIDAMAEAYTVPYRMITGRDLPPQYLNVTQQVSTSDPTIVSEAASRYVTAFIHGSS